jgi:hypothetical protein
LKALRLLENVIIGNFLYGLGFAIRDKSGETDFPSIISLLQQDPIMDKALGDVLLEFSEGIVRLIEFKIKRNDGPKAKERKKHAALIEDLQRKFIEEALKGIGENYLNISRSIHWFIEIDPKENKLISRIVPYLDAYPSDYSQYNFEDFIKKTADDAVKKSQPFPKIDLMDYISHIARLQIGSKKGVKREVPETSGILLVAGPSGKLKIADLPSMMDLKLQDREYINKILYQQNQAFVQDQVQDKSEIEQRLIEASENQNLRRNRGLRL